MVKKILQSDEGGESEYLDSMDRVENSFREALDNFYEWFDICRDQL